MPSASAAPMAAGGERKTVTKRASRPRLAGAAPSLRVERELMASGLAPLAGADEVGRGALCGPVTAGVVVIDEATKAPPRGLRDSKLLTPAARRSLVPRIERWAAACAVGHASAAEIDEIGILRALRLAAERAFAAIGAVPPIVLLDGNYDWLTRAQAVAHSPLSAPIPRVELKVKADLLCASAAAASVIAKVARDEIMVGLAERHRGYAWEENKGYATPRHMEALRELGPCPEHRRSWNLPGSTVLEDPLGADEEAELFASPL